MQPRAGVRSIFIAEFRGASPPVMPVLAPCQKFGNGQESWHAYKYEVTTSHNVWPSRSPR